VSAVIMYLAFYIWHGVLLNDFNHLPFSKGLFLGLSSIVYLVISFVLYVVFEFKPFKDKIPGLFLRGTISGMVVGFILFSITTVLSISFKENVNINYLLLDFFWQMIEQMIGGVVICFLKLIIFEPVPELSHDDDD